MLSSTASSISSRSNCSEASFLRISSFDIESSCFSGSPAYRRPIPRYTKWSRYSFSDSPFGVGNFGIKIPPRSISKLHRSATSFVVLTVSGCSAPHRAITSLGSVTCKWKSVRVMRFSSDKYAPVPTQSKISCDSWSSAFT